jgi:hypothetical protein
MILKPQDKQNIIFKENFMRNRDIIVDFIGLFTVIFFTIVIAVCFISDNINEKEPLETFKIPIETSVVEVVESTPTPTPTPRPVPLDSDEAGQYVLHYQHQVVVYEERIAEVSQYETIEEYLESLEDTRQELIDNYKYFSECYQLLVIEEEEAEWEQRYEEYPEATTIWLYLTVEMGYNEYVAAGVLGNIMNEAGGNSLNINPSAQNPAGYYGICQWNSSMYGDVWYCNLIEQLDYLNNTIEYEYECCGNMSYESFCDLTDEREAALSFARSYERCSSASYGRRQNNATTALNYFSPS